MRLADGNGAAGPSQQIEQRTVGKTGNAAAENHRALGEAVGDGIVVFEFFRLGGVVDAFGIGYESAEVGGSDADAGR